MDSDSTSGPDGDACVMEELSIKSLATDSVVNVVVWWSMLGLRVSVMGWTGM